MPVTPRGDTVELPPAEKIEAPTGQVALFKLLLPVAGVLVGLISLFLLLADAPRRNVFLFLGAYMLPGGIDYGIPIGLGALDLAPLWIIGLITYFDLWITAFWVWNLDHLVRFGWIERRVHKSRARTHKLWERFPWLQVATGPGLALFILIPIPWTGSFAGIAIGKLLDLPDPVIYAASIAGTFLRVTVLTYGWSGLFSLF